MRKISEILYKKFRPAVFIKWGLGRNSTSSALTRLAGKTYLAYKKDFSWPAPESLIRIRALSLSLTSIWCEIYEQGNCVKIYVFCSHLTWSELVRGKMLPGKVYARRRANWLRTFSHQQHSLKSMFLPLLLMQIRSSDINVALWFNLSSWIDGPTL